MKRVAVIVGLAILILAVAGCGSARTSDRAILHAGYVRLQSSSPSPSDATAIRQVKDHVRHWRAWVTTSAGSQKPPKTSPREFRRRLSAAAARYEFTVKRVEFFHGRNAQVLAPLVIVQTRHYADLARAIGDFLPSLCARDHNSCAPFFEAQDELGVPFIAVGIGQWARSEPLYPFVHG